MNVMRVMAVDYGDVRTGLAVSDLTNTLAGDVLVVREADPGRLAERLVMEARERGVSRIVVGHPRNMNGSPGPRAQKSESLAECLRALSGLPVALWDERRTSVDARRALHTAGRHGKKNKAMEDAVAAAIILEGYLAYLASHGHTAMHTTGNPTSI